MKKCFSFHQFFNEKNDANFLLSLRFIGVLIVIACIHIPLQGFSYNDVGHNKIKPEEAMRPMAANNKFHVLDTRITGTVRDEKGNPLTGVSVVIVGQQGGVTTDNSGNFSITGILRSAAGSNRR